jgi:hypothetical protein
MRSKAQTAHPPFRADHAGSLPRPPTAARCARPTPRAPLDFPQMRCEVIEARRALDIQDFGPSLAAANHAAHHDQRFARGDPVAHLLFEGAKLPPLRKNAFRRGSVFENCSTKAQSIRAQTRSPPSTAIMERAAAARVAWSPARRRTQARSGAARCTPRRRSSPRTASAASRIPAGTAASARSRPARTAR